MRILAAFVDHSCGATYAVIVNPIADGLGGLPARRYRLIRANSPNWVQEANTLRSISRTPGIQIYETFDCLEDWKDHPSFVKRRESLIREARQLAEVLSPRSPQ